MSVKEAVSTLSTCIASNFDEHSHYNLLLGCFEIKASLNLASVQYTRKGFLN